MDLLQKKDPTREEYILAHCLAILQMRKVGLDKAQKNLAIEEVK
jgi:hypothetical protein